MKEQPLFNETHPAITGMSERITNLEAEVLVLREYMRGLISLLPSERLEIGAMTGAVKRINAVAQQEPHRQASIARAFEQLNALSVHRIRPKAQP